jgi:hypothetical protein
VTLALASLTALVWLMGAAPQQAIKSRFYHGSVTAGGASVPAGLQVFARVGDWKSGSVQVVASAYQNLQVSPTDEKYVGGQVTFYLTNGFSEVKAQETDRIEASTFPSFELKQLDLHFTALPAPPPTPTPTATPTPTPTPTITPTPTPLLPIPGDPSVSRASQVVLLAGLAVFAVGLGLVMIARRRRAY